MSNQNLPTATTNDFFYILTNKDNDNTLELTDSERYLNTDLRDGPGVSWNTIDSGANPARLNEESFFEEGVYTIAVEAKDEAGNQNNTFEEEVIIDNFVPYVKKIEIGTPVKYSAEWTFDGTNLSIQVSTNEFIGVGNHPIAIEFSEPMRESAIPTLNIATFAAAITLTSTEAVNKKKKWQGTISLTSADNSHDGVQQLNIGGQDLASNLLDGRPDSIALRNAMGLFVDTANNSNVDDYNKVKIDTQAPRTSLTVTTTP